MDDVSALFSFKQNLTKSNNKRELKIMSAHAFLVCIIILKDFLSYHYFFSTAKDCSALNAPSNGSLVGNLTTYPHKVQFMCDEGFHLQGSKIRQCLSTGSWSGNDTLCDRK